MNNSKIKRFFYNLANLKIVFIFIYILVSFSFLFVSYLLMKNLYFSSQYDKYYLAIILGYLLIVPIGIIMIILTRIGRSGNKEINGAIGIGVTFLIMTVLNNLYKEGEITRFSFTLAYSIGHLFIGFSLSLLFSILIEKQINEQISLLLRPLLKSMDFLSKGAIIRIIVCYIVGNILLLIGLISLCIYTFAFESSLLLSFSMVELILGVLLVDVGFLYHCNYLKYHN